MNFSRKPAPQKIHAAPLEHIDPEKVTLYHVGRKPIYTGRIPTAEDEEKQADWDAVRDRHRRLLATKRHKHLPHPPALLDNEDDDEAVVDEDARDMERAVLASELCVWLTGDVDRERRAQQHQSRLDHARRSYYCTDAPLPATLTHTDPKDEPQPQPQPMGSVLFRKPVEDTAPPWIASQADMRATGAAGPAGGSRCYVKGYTPRKVTRPTRSKSSLELV